MIVAFSYIIAVVLTFALAVFLYPIAGLFWIMGLFGKISDNMFSFTTRVIKSLWKDIGGIDKPIGAQWVCDCGCINSGKFCAECGKSKVTEVVELPAETTEE